MPTAASVRPPVMTIAVHTVRGYFKERVLLVVLMFAFVLMLASYILSPMAVGAQHKVIVDIGLAAVSVFGVILVILLGAGSHSRERDRGILPAMLARPISRVDFITGKYLGTTITIWLVMVVMAMLFLFVMLLSKNVLNPTMFVAMYLSVLEIAVLTAVMTLFSTFTSPVLTSFFTFCIFVSGHLSKDLLEFAERFGGAGMQNFAKVAYYALPNLSMFNVRQEAVHELPLMNNYTGSVTTYAAFYVFALLLLSSVIFRRKDVM